MSAWKFGGDMIETLEQELNAIEALMELFDNGVDAGASRMTIALSSGSMTFTDNGRGCNDPNVMAQPYRSESKKVASAIGLRGVGGTRGMATFGRTQLIQTVTRAKKLYHRYRVVWNPDGGLPAPYDGHGESAKNAPAEIRNGGTKITVTGRQGGLTYNLDRICRELQKAYRPALSSGLSVAVTGPEENFGRQLRNPAFDSNKFEDPIKLLNGVADGKTFNVRYGVLKNEDAVLRGCHVIFGPRVMFTKTSIGKLSLPPSCYIDVILGSDWKQALSSRKNQIRYDEALDSALEKLLKDWLGKLREDAASIRLDLILGAATANINTKLAFLDKLIKGEFGAKPRKLADPGERIKRPRPEPDPDRIVHQRQTRAYPGGKYSAVQDEPSCLRIDLRVNMQLGNQLYSITYTPSAGVVTVYINCGVGQTFFEKALTNDGKSWTERGQVEAERVGFFAYAEAAADSGMRKESAPLFAALRKLGYEIDETAPAKDIMRMVMNFFYDQLGLGKLKVIDGGKAA